MKEVYFFISTKETIKIGVSGNWKGRLSDFDTEAARYDSGKWEVLARVAGSREDEQEIHDVFKKHRIPNTKETYYPVPELVEYITWLRDQYYVAVDSDDIPHAVPYSTWEPNSSRKKMLLPAEQTIGVGYWNRKTIKERIPKREVTTEDYYTPENITNAARKAMEQIDLDPSSHPSANRVVRATKILQKSENGLIHHWEGSVWLNPPFSEWKQWSKKVVIEWSSGRIQQICGLASLRNISAYYFSGLWNLSPSICIYSGRPEFWGKRAEGSTIPMGCFIFYLGPRVKEFQDSFQGLGIILEMVSSPTNPLRASHD